MVRRRFPERKPAMRLSKNEIASMACLTDQQLETWWQAIGTNPNQRVQTGPRKGLIKMSAIKKSDMVLAEIHRRRHLAPA
jgi:hypothetical protein